MHTVLTVAGFVLVIGSAIVIIVDAFHEGVAWGLLCLFFPVTQLVFVVVYWRDEKNRLLWMVVGFALIFVGASPDGSSSGDAVSP